MITTTSSEQPESSNLVNTSLPNIFSLSSWRIGTLNTQGLTNNVKRNLWFTFLTSSNFHIFIHSETNSNPHSSRAWQFPNFKTFWHNNDLQQSGSGIGISIKSELAYHIFKRQQLHGRILALDLTFAHNQIVRIIGVYLPPKGHKLRSICHQSITQLIREAQQVQANIIIAGDFNSTPNPRIDRHNKAKSQNKSKSNPECKTLDFLMSANFQDTFRVFHPSNQHFTWENKNYKSRIDQIWISDHDNWNISKADIIKSTPDIIHTDHHLSTCNLDTWSFTSKQWLPLLKIPNTRFNWTNTTQT